MPSVKKTSLDISRLLLAAAMAGCLDNPLAAGALQEYAVKAAVSLNFARFSAWPAGGSNASGPFINLCVWGDEPVQQAFNQVDKKQAGDKTLAVVDFSASSNLQQCRLIYISGQDNDKVKRLLAESSQEHVLTLGDDDGFLENGGMVYLQMTDGKINLQINLQDVKQAGITISSRVLKLATIVNP